MATTVFKDSMFPFEAIFFFFFFLTREDCKFYCHPFPLLNSQLICHNKLLMDLSILPYSHCRPAGSYIPMGEGRKRKKKKVYFPWSYSTSKPLFPQLICFYVQKFGNIFLPVSKMSSKHKTFPARVSQISYCFTLCSYPMQIKKEANFSQIKTILHQCYSRT